MRWEDERYVRIYTRDTSDWMGLSFIAQGLFCLLLRKVDRAGLLPLGKQGKRAVAVVIGHAGDWPRLEPALEELLADGCVRIEGNTLVVPNFIEAQEATMSDAQRQREHRARSRDIASRNVTGSHETGQKVTSGHTESRAVTGGHAESQAVTPCLAVPSRTEPEERDTRALDGLGSAWVQTYPAAGRLLDDLAAAGVTLTKPQKATVSASVNQSATILGPARALATVLEAHGSDPHHALGWYAGALHRAATGRAAGAKRELEPWGVPRGTGSMSLTEKIAHLRETGEAAEADRLEALMRESA